ncbi:cocaine esterase-like [Pollicipes pollicipes]|uniref:cocaine esterase-like n=1 Tax=Pollicipes pollicipes TaxID=41117 RepID=UPI001884B1E8|nr:cocaine esterase-like [Pollicipes pollicipes]
MQSSLRHSLLWMTLLAATTPGLSDCDLQPLVATRQGLVRGGVGRSDAGRIFHSFKGLPYARAPVGRLRFQPPQRHPGWEGAADATRHGSRCLQFDYFQNFTEDGSEDCLFANVYTPRLPGPHGGGGGGGLPVMVFIHGGGFTVWDGDEQWFGPRYFMDEDVVLVTFNYRLGPFGFFTTHDRHAPGNYGLLDQVMLLRWVRDNIAFFGGDPEAVTIFGESAGGTSVSLMVISPLARGLFHHAISQSGSAISTFGVSGRQQGSATKFATQLNCSTEDVAAMVECVREVSAHDLNNAVKELGVAKVHFYPRVDREADSPLLPESPRLLLERGDFNLVPWIQGQTEEEGTLLMFESLSDPAVMARLFAGNLTQWGLFADLTTASTSRILDCGADPAEEVRKVFDFYAGNATLSYDNLLPLARVAGDREVLVPMTEELLLASQHAPVYQYVLDHRGAGRLSFPEAVSLLSPDLGPTHGDDLLYLFANERQAPPPAGHAAHTMIRFVVSLWSSFARTGRPHSSVLAMPDWPLFTERSRRYMRINSEPSLGEHLGTERVRFWQTVRVNEPWRHPVQASCTEEAAAAPEGEM